MAILHAKISQGRETLAAIGYRAQKIFKKSLTGVDVGKFRAYL
jgi:hypothetical protein